MTDQSRVDENGLTVFFVEEDTCNDAGSTPTSFRRADVTKSVIEQGREKKSWLNKTKAFPKSASFVLLLIVCMIISWVLVEKIDDDLVLALFGRVMVATGFLGMVLGTLWVARAFKTTSRSNSNKSENN